jgi:hypothetical protein
MGNRNDSGRISATSKSKMELNAGYENRVQPRTKRSRSVFYFFYFSLLH